MVAAFAFVAMSVVSATPSSGCVLEGPQGARAWASCGTVDVALDARDTQPTARRVPIAWARLDATDVDDVRDPIVLLAGGPGQAATRDFVPVLPALDELRAHHDIVLVDVRGTGRSQPQRCRDGRPLAARLSGAGDDDVLAACRDALTIDARFLTTADAARDVDAVRAALGLERWHVLGVSYGTRLALLYDQQFPGRALTLTLDGVAPLDRALGDDVAVDMTASLAALGDDTVAAFRALKARLLASPEVLQVRHPTTGALVELTATSAVVNGAVRMLLYATETRAVLPALLRSARAGDTAPLVALAVMAAETLEGAIHAPVNGSVLCAEDVPFLAEAAAGDAVVFDDERPAMRRQCARWPTIPPARFAFTGTKTPTLLLSGEFDPITPPRHVERVVQRFADAVHVVVRGHGHNVMARGCVPSVIADFVDRGAARGLDVACVSRMGALPAFVDPMGPAP